MASYIDLGSSPDPLGDDDMEILPPSSMRPPPPPSSRRITKTISTGRTHTSMLSQSGSRLSTTSSRRSPRKQTFELDVGDEDAPQRLLVTVEANQMMSGMGNNSAMGTQRSNISRRLFAPSSSPARSRSNRRENTTTTTTLVPLRGLTDDEGGDLGSGLNMPRKRGRPLGSKNGTPAPRGKKRSGTPLARQSPAKTRQSKNPESEMSMFSSDAQLDMGTDGVDPIEDDPTPKPKAATRARKNTPAAKRAGGGTPAVAAPSSSKPTGRKRGRPRKALNHDEMAMLTSEVDNREINSDLLLFSEDQRKDAPSEMEAIPEGNEDSRSHHDLAPSSSPPRDAPGNYSPPRDENIRSDGPEADLMDQLINDLHEDEHEDDHFSYGAMREAESDDDDNQSEARAGSEATDGRQDTLAHASDFSMIAVESLPSFQASFQRSQNEASRFGASNQSRFPEGGDETNYMINRSLRRSMKDSAQGGEPPKFAEGGDETNFMINQSLRSMRGGAEGAPPREEEEQPARQEKSQLPSHKATSSILAYSSPSNYVLSSPQTWSKSPKRMRQTPLSRQVFAKSAQKAAPVADDSFSSLPDSVLRDATPGKPRAGKPTDMDIDRTDDTEMQDDSFSEIPDEVLEAATPGPSTRTSKNPVGADNPGSQLYSADIHSAARSTNAFGSTRLPTPDDTNSSTTGSKNAHEEEARKGAGESATAAINTSDLNIHSSPPRIGVQSADDVDMQPAQSEGNAVGTPSPNNSSPSPQYPHAKLDSPGLADLLQPPMSTRRPTLSPIVRVGRSLQHVMSDRSSPEGRESSLGSPFRRSGSDSRQSSVQKSPINEKREYSNQPASASKTQSLFNPIASLAQSIRSNFAQVSHRAPSPSMMGRVEGSFSTEKAQLPPQAADAFGKSVAGAPPSDQRHSLQGSVQQLEQFPLLVTSSARADPPSEAFPDWTGEDSSPTAQRTRRMSAPKSLASMNSSNIFAARGINANSSRVIEETEEDVTKEEEISNEQLLSEDQSGVHYQDGQLQVNGHGDVHQQDEQDFSDSEQERFEGGDDMAYEEEESLHESVNEEEQDAVDDQLQSEANDDDDQGHEQPSEGEESLAQSVERDVSEDGRGDEEAMRDDNTVVDEGFDENTRSQHDFDESLESQPNFDMGDDGMDLWDIEASRPTPKPKKFLRAESRARRHSQVDIIARSSQSREPSVLHGSTTTNGDSTTRRNKVPSPWKKNVRRLIYQDEFKSPAHIEMGDSPLSEEPEEEYSLIAQLAAQDEAPVPQEQMRPEPQAMPEEEMWSEPEAMPQHSPSLSPEPQQEVAESPQEEVPTQMERLPEQPTPAPRAAEETEDYSMLSQQKPEPPKTLEKPVRRSGLFGVFDIMSFFSSPAPLPVTNTPNGAAPETINRPIPKPHVRSQLSSAAKSQPEEPQSVLRATGLFPSIPQKASFRVSPERQTNLFSPGTAPRSGDTIADTYDEMPSTPERQSPLPHIPQKLNFTPRTDRTIHTASLFTPSVAPSTPDRNNDVADEDAPEPEEQDYYLREQESDDYEGDEPVGHDDSVMTVESEYERLPPREKPSKWDKNASPTKSCLRSPLKPKTPGRVVEFAGNNRPVSTSEQIQTWMMGRPALGAVGTGGNSLGQSQGQGRRPQFVEYEEEEEEEEEDEGDPDDKENSPSPPKDYNNHFPAHFAATHGGQRAVSPAKAVVAPPNIKMPATTAMAAPPNIKMPATTMFRVPNGGQNAANGVKPLFSLQPNGAQNAVNGAKALPPISLQPFSRAATNRGGGDNAGSSTVTAPSSGSSAEPPTWQKAHWIHLDELLQLRRNEPAKFRHRQAKFQSSQSRSLLDGSSSPPRSAALIGKEVSAQGERVVLEPWHLEIVDAFRAEMGDGWDEKSLAKRLFALIVGEERRRRGGASKGRGKKATAGGV